MIQMLLMIHATEPTTIKRMAGTMEMPTTTNNIKTAEERAMMTHGGITLVMTPALMMSAADVTRTLTILTAVQFTVNSQHTVCIHRTVGAVASAHAHNRVKCIEVNQI